MCAALKVTHMCDMYTAAIHFVREYIHRCTKHTYIVYSFDTQTHIDTDTHRHAHTQGWQISGGALVLLES